MSTANAINEVLALQSPAKDSVTPLLETLRTRGYALLRDHANSTLMRQVNEELEPWFEHTPHCQGDFYGWETTRVGSVLFKAPSSASLLLDPLITALVTELLGPYCDWYQLNLSQAIRLHPGQRQQFPHRDDDMWPCAKTHEYMVNVMWALSDFTADNGATLIWPGVRTSPDANAMPDPQAAVAAAMPQGSALVYLGSTVHCGGENLTVAPRTGLIFSYSLGWLKPYENPFLAYPPAIARQFAPPVRDLLGYRIHRPNLGNYEGQDPSVIFETDSRTLATVDALPPAIQEQLHRYYHTPT